MMYKLSGLLFCCFALFILWVIYLANGGYSSIFFDLVKVLPYGDKIGHFLLFGVLALLANLAFRFRRLSIGRFQSYWGSALVTAFFSLEELSQYFLPERTLDAYDFLASFLGVVVFSGVSRVFESRVAAADARVD